MKKLCVILAIALPFFTCDRASTGFSQAEMIRAIIGEASNQSLQGQIAIACGIFNRVEGLEGVYGAEMTRTPAPAEIKKARKALNMATPDVCFDLIRGADMWENVSAFGQPENWGAVYFIRQIEDHHFYRRIKKGE